MLDIPRGDRDAARETRGIGLERVFEVSKGVVHLDRRRMIPARGDRDFRLPRAVEESDGDAEASGVIRGITGRRECRNQVARLSVDNSYDWAAARAGIRAVSQN